MYALVLLVHVIVCLFLIAVILVQGGRGGLSEAMGGAAAQSLFGGGVTTVLTRVTTVCAGLFVITCLSLAYLSTQRGRSVIEQIPMSAPGVLPLRGPSEGANQPPAKTESKPVTEAPAPSAPAASTPAAPADATAPADSAPAAAPSTPTQ